MGAVHPRVLGHLGRALSLELSAVQQYMTHAALVEAWGDAEAAERFRHETVEEMKHAESIVQRMLRLGVAPAASQLKPVSHARDLAGLLRANLGLEAELIALYTDATRFCRLSGDHENGAFFERLWREEQHHGDELGGWLAGLAGQSGGLAARASF